MKFTKYSIHFILYIFFFCFECLFLWRHTHHQKKMAGITGPFCITSDLDGGDYGVTNMRINNVVLTSNICDTDESQLSLAHGGLLPIILGCKKNRLFPGKHMAIGRGDIEPASRVPGAKLPQWEMSGGVTVFLRKGKMGGTGSSSPLSNYCKLATMLRRLQKGIGIVDIEKLDQQEKEEEEEKMKQSDFMIYD